jgi:hypothetical protein
LGLGGLAGGVLTVNVLLLVAEPNGVLTITKPVVPVPIVTVIVVDVLAVIVAGVPPIVTEVAVFKKVPFIIKEFPGQSVRAPYHSLINMNYY